MRIWPRVVTVTGALLVVSGCSAPSNTHVGAAEWPMYRNGYSGTGYSPLSQIDTSNVAGLTSIWSYRLQSASNGDTGQPTAGRGPNSQATPIVVNGLMYLPAADRIVALEPQTGDEIWRHHVAGGTPSRRGVAYWPGEGDLPPRVLFTAGPRLIALDALTGSLADGFGTAGEVDMGVPYNSVPLVFEHIVVVGANAPPGSGGAVGNPRAFDARTGAKLWEFSSVPQPGHVGHDTWEGDSWQNRLGANAWTFYFTLDEERGLLYVPLASPSPGAYGGDRKGANLFGNSLVALDVRTGTHTWHFQTIHHDLWDADPPAPPSLFEIERGGQRVPALALTTKSGYLYLLNRETGEPIFGVEERPVPASDVPGELASPTQPFPVKPLPLGRVAYTPADLVTADDTTPEHAQACADLVDQLGNISNAGPFTPWRYRAPGAPPSTTLVFPGTTGATNWGGTAFDPASGYIFVVTQDVGALGSIEQAPEGSPVPYVKVAPARSTFDVPMGDMNWPCQKPPWGGLVAVDAATGDVVWRVPLGITEQLPEAKRRTGRPTLAGPVVTAGGLVFVASTDDNRFRALDARTGEELWAITLAQRGNANPMTYQGANGTQYVAVVATDTLEVYALP